MASQLPPDPTNAVLKRIYPWDEYDISLVMQWLYKQAQKTGFLGDFDDFKLRYGAYIEAQDPQDIYNIIESYTGTYHITPLVGIEQVLQTKNKVLNKNVVIDAVPPSMIHEYDVYRGSYRVTPMANFTQIMHTKEKLLEEQIVVEKIPYYTTSNVAGGYTAIIG